MPRLVSVLGLAAMVGACWLMSSDRRRVDWRTVAAGLALQVLLAVLILKTGPGERVFHWANLAANRLLDYSVEGSRFVFGSLVDVPKHGFVFAFFALPPIIFVSALAAWLHHAGLMHRAVALAARAMARTMRVSGGESLVCAANVFAGQSEAPLVVRPLIGRMTRSELMAMMTGGLATMSGSMLIVYAGMGMDAGHLLAASVMSAPAALVCAKIMVPETAVSETMGRTVRDPGSPHANAVDAVSSGATDGLRLALNVAAMLIALISLVAFANGLLSWAGGLLGVPGLSLELVVGLIFSPAALLLGIPWDDAARMGSLLGKKLVLNEFIAYVDLREMAREGCLSPRSVAVATYALCGFANLGSVAMQVGGIGALVPERKRDLSLLGGRALAAGTLACMMTACVAGALL